MQTQKILLQTMQNHGIDISDFAANEYAEISDPKARRILMRIVWEQYLEFAKIMGIVTGLEHDPPPSIDDSTNDL